MFKLDVKALIIFAAFGLLGSQSFAANYFCSTYTSVEDGRRFTGIGRDQQTAAANALFQCKTAPHADSHNCRANMSCQLTGGGGGGHQQPNPWPGHGGNHHPNPNPYPNPYPQPEPNPYPQPQPNPGQGFMYSCRTASGASVYQTGLGYDIYEAANNVVNTCLANPTSYKPDCQNNLTCSDQYGQPVRPPVVQPQPYPEPNPYPQPYPQPQPQPQPGGMLYMCRTVSGASVYQTSQYYDLASVAESAVSTCMADPNSYKPDCRNNLYCTDQFGQQVQPPYVQPYPQPYPEPGGVSYRWINGRCGQYSADGVTFIQYVEPRFCGGRQ